LITTHLPSIYLTDFSQLNESQYTSVSIIENNCHITPWSSQSFNNIVSSGYWSLVLLKEIDSVFIPIGYIVFMRNDEEWELLNFTISLHMQRQGLGSFLIQHALLAIQELGAEKVFLEVRESSYSVINIYNKLGFKTVGRRKNYYLTNTATDNIKHREDALVMCLEYQGTHTNLIK
jgi:ribosomal-protein-alanine N-acetyltransferase